MPKRKEPQSRSATSDRDQAGSGIKAADQAMSSKRLKSKDKLDKNKGAKPAGDPRSGSDSNASRRTTGH